MAVTEWDSEEWEWDMEDGVRLKSNLIEIDHALSHLTSGVFSRP
jgi:hypothetical protein